MSSKPNIPKNDSKQAASSLRPKNPVKEKGIQQGVFSRYYSALRSVFQKSQSDKTRSKVTPPTESHQTRISLKSEKIITNKLLASLLGFCSPICGTEIGSCPNENQPHVVCLPCTALYKETKAPKKREPVGMVTFAKDVELSAGKLVFGCQCGKKNGLAGEANCPRSCCQNNPGCFMNPPQCWPQFQEDPPPPKTPEQNIICIPMELVYYKPSSSC